MIKIEVNGTIVQAKEGDMLIDVSDQAGILIPRFCYHKKLSIAANCRMCLIEVEGFRKPLPACATPVTDGMKVHTKSKVAIAAQKSVMEFLLINHPLDCPICDQGGECELQDISYDYGDDISRFSEPKRVLGAKDMGPLIHTDMTRCIHCTRCVRFGQEIGGVKEMGATGRNESVQIGTYIEQAITSELSGNMIDICPVGALTSKPFRYTARSWELKSYKTIAPHDSFGSNIIVHTKADEIKRVVPDENEEINEVWISDKDRFSYEGIHSKQRLIKPAIKKKGVWEDVDWETALAFAASKIEEIQDKQNVGCLASPNSTLEELYLLKKCLAGVGITNIDTRLRQVDFDLDKNGYFTPQLNHSLSEIRGLKSVLLIGTNLRHELPMLNHRLRQSQYEGNEIAHKPACISSINPNQIDSNLILSNELIAENFVQLLAEVAKACCETPPAYLQAIEISEEAQKIADSLNKHKNSSLFIGQISQTSDQYTNILKMSKLICEHTESELSVLPMFANEVGASQIGFVPNKNDESLNTTQMLQNNMKLFINFGIDVEHDITNVQLAKDAMEQAETVINITCFDSEYHRETADVLLPLSTFAETPGTFVNLTGIQQSFKPVIEAVGDSKPGWKIIRVLGNLLRVDNFDYVNSQQVLDEIKPKTLNFNDLKIEQPEAMNLDKTSYKSVNLYASDSLVRHSQSLQQMAKLIEQK